LIAIEKRIKRHILSRPASFFASTAPGIETLCHTELLNLGFPAESLITETGGVVFSGRVHDGYLANLYLRTANRILMRMAVFSATHFRGFEKHAADLPWELYLPSYADCRINVASKKSRLFHSDALADRLNAAIAQRRQTAGIMPSPDVFDAKPLQRIFVRAQDDRFTISLDSSGELLHRRGIKTHAAIAPIRETIASAILMLSGYRPGDPLVDPMCGAGTFSLEAAMITNHIPAGWYRGFAFMEWPCFKETRWRHLRREANKKMRDNADHPLIFTSDIDPNACRDLKNAVRRPELEGTMTISIRNFFDLTPADFPIPASRVMDALMVINPPYGRRLAAASSEKQDFAAICRKLTTDFKGWKVALIAPEQHLLNHAPRGLTARSFFHGGLRPYLLTGRIA
jgi:putative N6-adenine-specific DNA methylase